MTFCLCWANVTWSGIWYGDSERTLIKQEYPGKDDDEKHFNSLLTAFRDDRYLCINGCPIFIVWRSSDIPGLRKMTDRWRSMAKSAGLPGLYLIGH